MASFKSLKRPVNPLPTQLPSVTEQDNRLLQLYLREWEVVVNTQMHFNDLILRFRAITLTALATLVGATLAVERLTGVSKLEILSILGLLLGFWLTAFIMGFSCYHRLLLGSVAQAFKFDESETLKSYGLFGMTSCITGHVRPRTSRVLVVVYYLVPFTAIAVLMALLGTGS